MFEVMKSLYQSLVTRLNIIGTLLMAYALNVPGGSDSIIEALPENLQPLGRVILPIIWFALVEGAKKRDTGKADLKREEQANVQAEEG